MLVMKIACGEGAIKNDGIGDIHVAMLASNLFRVYVEGGALPDGGDDEKFYDMKQALDYATHCATLFVEAFVKENPL